MLKSTLGVVLLLAFASAYGQQHGKSSSHSGGQSHGGGASHATHSSGGGSRGSSGGGSARRSTGSSGGYSSHNSTGSHRGTHSGTHRGTGGGSRGGGGGRNVSLRPGGAGHPRDWFEHQHWMEGPGYQTPQFSCYAGFLWNVQPANAILVWVFDPTSNQYYQAYYYPTYGYYAWTSNPLVAVGEYSPQIAIVIH